MLASFLDQLFQTGKITLATARPLRTVETAAIDRLRLEENAYRAEFPGVAPPFSLDAGYWAATTFYRAAQFFAARDLPAEAVAADLSIPCPMTPSTAEAIYSVDVTLRFLPDLYKLSAARASADPLVNQIRQLADTWPLSGTGIPAGEAREQNSAFLVSHDGLRRQYIDRIIALKAFSLLTSAELQTEAKTVCQVHFPEYLQHLPGTAELNC